MTSSPLNEQARPSHACHEDARPHSTDRHAQLDRRRRPARALERITLALLTALAISCAGQSNFDVEEDLTPEAEPVFTTDGLQLVRSTPRSRLWVKPDHHIGRYDSILVTGIGFRYGSGQQRLDSGQEAKIGSMLQGAIRGITAGSPVGTSDKPGPCVVALRLGLKDIYLHIMQNTGSSVSFVSSFGSATMIVEFRDSTTDVPLLRYAANRGLGGGPGTGRIGAHLGKLGGALSKMVADMTTELRAIVPATTVRPNTECNNGIYKLTGRG
jgi:hypothetical protein